MILGVEDAAHLTCSIKLFVGSWVWCYAATYGNARHSWDAAKHTRTHGHPGYTIFSTCWNSGLHPVQNRSYANSPANDWSISHHLWHPSRWPSNRSPGMSYCYSRVNGAYFHSDIVAGQNCSCLSYSWVCFSCIFFWGIFPSLLLNIMKRSSPASFEKKKCVKGTYWSQAASSEFIVKELGTVALN